MTRYSVQPKPDTRYPDDPNATVYHVMNAETGEFTGRWYAFLDVAEEMARRLTIHSMADYLKHVA